MIRSELAAALEAQRAEFGGALAPLYDAVENLAEPAPVVEVAPPRPPSPAMSEAEALRRRRQQVPSTLDRQAALEAKVAAAKVRPTSEAAAALDAAIFAGDAMMNTPLARAVATLGGTSDADRIALAQALGNAQQQGPGPDMAQYVAQLEARLAGMQGNVQSPAPVNRAPVQDFAPQPVAIPPPPPPPQRVTERAPPWARPGWVR